MRGAPVAWEHLPSGHFQLQMKLPQPQLRGHVLSISSQQGKITQPAAEGTQAISWKLVARWRISKTFCAKLSLLLCLGFLSGWSSRDILSRNYHHSNIEVLSKERSCQVSFFSLFAIKQLIQMVDGASHITHGNKLLRY